MKDDEQFDSDGELTAALRSLAPAAIEVDPVTAAFTAGRNSARGQMRLWRGISIATIALCVAVWNIPTHSAPAIPPVMAALKQTPAPELPPDSVVMLQQAVIEHGLDGLPQSSSLPYRPVDLSDFQ
jgi:hypothetical protein